MNLELMAMRWLWLEKMCHYVLEQRSPRLFRGVPDVIGITKSRFIIEIEIKRSVADFRNDAKKPHIANRGTDRVDMIGSDYTLRNSPKHFYYMMPRRIADKVIDEIPPWAGLMCEQENQLTAMVLKKAPANSHSKRLSLEECIRAVRLMVNHMMTTQLDMEAHKNYWKHNDTTTHVDWVRPENGAWEI